ncbi:unnamed protein product, partial [Polarella glacialis]
SSTHLADRSRRQALLLPMGSQQSSEASSAAAVSPGQDPVKTSTVRTTSGQQSTEDAKTASDRPVTTQKSVGGGFLIEPDEDVCSQEGESMHSVQGQTAKTARDENAIKCNELMDKLLQVKPEKASEKKKEKELRAESLRLYLMTSRISSVERARSAHMVIKSPMLDCRDEFDSSSEQGTPQTLR